MFSQNSMTKFNRLLTYSNLVHPVSQPENHWLVSLGGEVKKIPNFQRPHFGCVILNRLSRHCKWPVIFPRLSKTFDPFGPRPAAALSLQNPMQREVTVSNDPGIQL